MTTNNRFEEFILSIPSVKSQEVYKSYSSLGEFDYTNCDVGLVENAILNTNPKSTKSITTACNILKKYAEYLGNKNLLRIVNSIDRKELWIKAKPDELQKFISHKQLEWICHDISLREELNALYYETLFMAIYEGIYSKDMSVLKNLRAKDIEDNKVTLNPDVRESYTLNISKELANNLRKLSKVTTWDQTARSGDIHLSLVGDFEDTCFKTVQRTNKNEPAFYYRRIRKIASVYVEYPLRPYELFVSGLVYRISEELKANGITLQEAFSTHYRSPKVRNVFVNELSRCHYSNTVSNFREMIMNYLDVFLE